MNVPAAPVESCVGIFWRIQMPGAAPSLLVDAVPIQRAEPYGEFLTHGGRYEFWMGIADLHAPRTPEPRSAGCRALVGVRRMAARTSRASCADEPLCRLRRRQASRDGDDRTRRRAIWAFRGSLRRFM
jgi:hypothetical protein